VLPAAGSAPTAKVLDDSATKVHVRVGASEAPSWLVLGESLEPGWTAEVDGRDLGEPKLVDGFAQGWQIPPGPERTVTLTWSPQRTVDIGLLISALVSLLCVALVALDRRRFSPAGMAPNLGARLDHPFAPRRPAGRALGVLAALGTGALGAFVVSLPAGLLLGLLTAAALWWRRGAGLIATAAVGLAALAFVATVVARVVDEDLLAFDVFANLHAENLLLLGAIVLLVASLLVDALRGGGPRVDAIPGRRRRAPEPVEPAREEPVREEL
jgi:hypothetical protein